MAETRTYTDGKLTRLVIDNRDKSLSLSLEDLTRQIPNTVARVEYKEFNAADVQTFTFTRTRVQLLNILDTYSKIFDFVYYPSGAINTIRIRTYDATPALLSDKTVKHYEDSRRPVII